MSQKKLKKLRKLETENLIEKKASEIVMGFRQILKENWKFLTLLIIGIFALYLNSLNGAFVSDDYATIPNNPNILSLKNGLSGSLVGLSNWFLAMVFGIKNPMFFHLFSLILFVLSCILVFVFISLVINKKVAILTTILFAVLPINVETVSWISGKPYLFTTMTVLFTLILFILYLKTGIKKYFWFFIISLPVTFFAEKVRSLSVVLIIPLFILTFGNVLKVNINLITGGS